MTTRTTMLSLAFGALLALPAAAFAQDQAPPGGNEGTRKESQNPGATTATTVPGMQRGADKETNPTTGSEPRSPGTGTAPGGTTGGGTGGGTGR